MIQMTNYDFFSIVGIGMLIAFGFGYSIAYIRYIQNSSLIEEEEK